MIIAVDLERVAELAAAEAYRHQYRTRERRAAAHLFVSLTVPLAKSADAARKAILSFGDDRTQADALALMHQLASTATERETPA